MNEADLHTENGDTGPDEPSGPDVLIARLGVFAFLVPPGTKKVDIPELAESLVAFLKEDSRVASVEAPKLEMHFCYLTSTWPAADDSVSDSVLINGLDRRHVLQLSSPIEFEIHVPEKNQPSLVEDKVIPSEDYRVTWDGHALMVTFQAPGDQYVGPEGGHVVQDILRQAAVGARGELFVQGCSPGCEYLFIHTGLRLRGADDGAFFTVSEGEYPFLRDVPVPQDASREEIEGKVFRTAQLDIRTFAEMKNFGQRLLDVEQVARRSLDELLGVQFERAGIPSLPRRSRLKARWNLRGWRKQSNVLLSKMWMILATVERLRRRWEEERFSFAEASESDGVHLLFSADHRDDEERIRSLQPDMMTQAVQHAASRLDNRALALATALGAIAGAASAIVVRAIG